MNIEEEFKKFLLTVNCVTAYHRHGQKIPKKYLDNLSNAQLDMEALLNGTTEYDEEKEHELDQLHDMNGW